MLVRTSRLVLSLISLSFACSLFANAGTPRRVTTVTEDLLCKDPHITLIRHRAKDLAKKAKAGRYQDVEYKPGYLLHKQEAFCNQFDFQRQRIAKVVMREASQDGYFACELKDDVKRSFFYHLKKQLLILCD